MIPCILFEDEHLLVVNKPCGLNTHAPSPYASEGLYEWLRHREPRWSRLAIIHRLDKETSGVLVFSLSERANRELTRQFATRKVEKTYLLLTDREFASRSFLARGELVRAGERYVDRPGAKGALPAETRFQRVEVNGGVDSPGMKLPQISAGGVHLWKAQPLTGRTHQIRVQAAEHGLPILGDSLYGGTAAARLCLHAAEIAFRHPYSGAPVVFRAPADFEADARRALRSAVIEPDLTSAFRLVHGASDGQRGKYVDKLGDYLLLQTEKPVGAAERAEVEPLLKSGVARGAYHKMLTRHVRGVATASSSP
ncbi:MAG TPA: pseudouridine synthase, partial [Verrucomicrobiae bacterium]|nr:pseudouridine synthase [Verrucomicrobiae bacterium]